MDGRVGLVGQAGPKQGRAGLAGQAGLRAGSAFVAFSGMTILRLALAGLLLTATPVLAQVDCWTPREHMNSVATARFSPIRQTLLAIEQITRGNSAYQAAPEPVRMRTTLIAGPSEAAGGRIFVRAYPPMQGTIRIWTPDRCDVVPQSERVAASVGQVYAFINYNIQEQFLDGDEVPAYEGEVAGFPVYEGRIVLTRNRRLPWIPQTLADRLGREEQKRMRALEEWSAAKTNLRMPDEAAQMKTYQMLKQTDPKGAEQFLATTREVAAGIQKATAEASVRDAHLQAQLKAVRDYRASFSAAQLNSPAVWMDPTGDGRARLESRIADVHQRTPKDQRESGGMQIEALRAEYDLTNLKPGTPAKAMAFKPDPTFPDFTDALRPQVITLQFWSKSDPADGSPRSVWLKKTKDSFDIAAVAALLR